MEDFSFDVKYSFLGVSISQPLEKSAAAVVTWLRQPNQKLFLSILFWTLRLTLTTVIYERPARIGQLNDLLSLQHWLSSMMQERVHWTMGSLFFFPDQQVEAARGKETLLAFNAAIWRRLLVRLQREDIVSAPLRHERSDTLSEMPPELHFAPPVI